MKHPKTYSLPACPSSSSSRSPSPTSSSDSNTVAVSSATSSATEAFPVPSSPAPTGLSPDGAPGFVYRSPGGAKIFGPPGESVAFVELLARSNFSFLQGASHPDEMVKTARQLGYKGLALCDVNGLYGIVRGYQAVERPSAFDTDQRLEPDEPHQAETKAGSFRYLCGAELTPYDSSPVALMPINKDGYVALCHLLTSAKRRAPKGHLVLSLKTILAVHEHLLAFPLPPWKKEDLLRLQEAFQERLFLPVHRDLTWDSIRLYQQALQFESELGLTLFATQRPLFHHPSRQRLHDVLTCILHKTTLESAATRLAPNGERHLKTLPELAILFRERPDLLERTTQIAALVKFSLAELRYKYPQAHLPEGMDATEHLRYQVEKGLKWRYPSATTSAEHALKARELVEKELEIIRQMEYEDYFLTLWDICQFAHERGILYQGRGSAANSIVCYTLGLTAANPVECGFMFERFISTRRREPPDIDVDFEHARREEVIQYIYQKYGERHAAMVCTVIRYRSRLAVREVAKVFGVPNEQIDGLTKYMGREGLERLVEMAGWSRPGHEGRAAEADNVYDGSGRTGLPVGGGMPASVFARAIDSFAETKPWLQAGPSELEPFGLNRKRFALLVQLAKELLGFPRHLGIHSGGFVISHEPVIDIVPVEAATKDGRFVVQWNKDDVNTLGLMKLDILSLGMLTAIQKSFALLRQHKNIDLTMATVPPDDKQTYEMIQKAETVGVFQIESRAQMSLLPRLKPACYYDLVIEVAIVRPGPIQGGMVHPFLRRRSGKEKVTYAHPCLKPILKKTMGIPLFQEQVMQIAVEAAGFSPEESDDLRRIMSSAWRRKAVMGNIHQRVVSGMLSKGIARDYAEQIYKTIEGFSSYGFPESHAASFALITYVSCFLKKHHPDAFVCALLNSQPMGFYAPRQLVAEAQRNGVHFDPLDAQHSDWEYTLTPPRLATVAARVNSAGLKLHTVIPPRVSAEDTRRPPHVVRVGMCSVYGVREEQARRLVDERRQNGSYRDLTDLVRRSRLPRPTLLRLAGAGALASFGLNARQALWAIQGMSFDTQSLFFGAPVALDHARLESESETLPVENPWENVRREYKTKGFAVDSHPLGVLRPLLLRDSRPYTTALQLQSLRDRAPVRIAGLMSLLQKPPTAKGMCFISLEDETGLMNVVITPDVYQEVRLVLLQSPLLEVEGFLESREGVYNVRAKKIRPLANPMVAELPPLEKREPGFQFDAQSDVKKPGALAPGFLNDPGHSS